jgi:hypothetical protein
LTAQENNNRVGFGRNETKKEGILCTTVIAFKNGIAEGGLRMQLDFFVSSADQVVDDVGGRSVATCTAEPFTAGQTFDNAARIMDAAVSTERN